MFDMPESMTIWNEIGNDGFGNKIYSDPIHADCRIAYKQEEKTDQNGDVFMSKAVFYSYSDSLKIDSKILLGSHSSSLSPDPRSDDVKMVSNTPSGSGSLKKGWF